MYRVNWISKTLEVSVQAEIIIQVYITARLTQLVAAGPKTMKILLNAE